MTVIEVEKLIQKRHVDPLSYSIGTPKQTQCDVIDHIDGVWTTYYWERGIRHFLKRFPDESSAAEDFLCNVLGVASVNEHCDVVPRN